MRRLASIRAVRRAAVVLLLLQAATARAVDLTGSWWVHPDPFDGSGFANVTCEIAQSGDTLSFDSVLYLNGVPVTPGSGEGTIDPSSGIFAAAYGYVYFLEPVRTGLSATASGDGNSFTGNGHVSLVYGGLTLYNGAVIGVRLTGAPAVCGNGALELGEICDDGNSLSDDGCSAACVREPGCGDRIRDAGEDCDDGNAVDGDGCSASCVREPRCGDGVPDPGEECDDGNDNEADACSSTCQRLTECGNSVLEFGEQCDDGNTADEDCCSAACRFVGRICRPSTGPCDLAESCTLGMCPPDFGGNGDVDQDGTCDSDDACRDVEATRGFIDRSRLMLTQINDGISYNERLMLRAAFDLPATTPFSDFDPTSSITMIRFTSRYWRVLEAFLLPTVYGGPGTSGWWRHPTQPIWVWRDKRATPSEDVVAVRISAVQTADRERVQVRIVARAHGAPFGLAQVVPSAALPLQGSVTLGSFFHGRAGRCGQSRFTDSSCTLGRGETRIVCE